MPTRPDTPPMVEARVESVLPKIGLAFVSDGELRWGVTRTAIGDRFDSLSPGVRVRLELQQQLMSQEVV